MPTVLPHPAHYPAPDKKHLLEFSRTSKINGHLASTPLHSNRKPVKEPAGPQREFAGIGQENPDILPRLLEIDRGKPFAEQTGKDLPRHRPAIIGCIIPE